MRKPGEAKKAVADADFIPIEDRNLVCHCLAIVEVYLVLHFMRVPVSLV